ncbi:hypothetical protein FHP25_08750 [Vineibacter terrae]|uniref:Uncharacterized protein n=1 Tax=Vineibacter terrae TaxID=2586908 RepID=A0A5C8PR27_9HYPH|nr:hypothetical protein [Vineibacter terrae]TXL78267.1 hypothetical protein FHP25_08750 [Vineibacter terrae]
MIEVRKFEEVFALVRRAGQLTDAEKALILADRDATLALSMDPIFLNAMGNDFEQLVRDAAFICSLDDPDLPEWYRPYEGLLEPAQMKNLRQIWWAPIGGMDGGSGKTGADLSPKRIDPAATREEVGPVAPASRTAENPEPVASAASDSRIEKGLETVDRDDDVATVTTSSVSCTARDLAAPLVSTSTHRSSKVETEGDVAAPGKRGKRSRAGIPFVPAPGERLTLSHDKMMVQLEKVTREIGPSKMRLRDAYLLDPQFRRAYNSINIELNIRGRVAPYWRPHPKLPPVGHTAGQKVLNNDKRVLDLHWLFLHARPASLRDLRFQDLFKGDEFDYVSAWTLVETIGKTTHILGHLNLSLETQMGLTALRSRDARELFSVIEKDADALANRLRHSRQPRYEMVADDWRNVWLAYGIAMASISGGSSSVAEPTIRHVASIYRLITGRVERMEGDPDAQTICDRAIGDKLKRIKSWVAKGAA